MPKPARKGARIVHALKPTNEEVRLVVRGEVTAVLPDGRARFETSSGGSLDCACPQHVQLEWLRAALAVSPVVAEASVTSDGRQGSIWALFPGPQHQGVVPEDVHVVASGSLTLACGSTTVALTKDGKMRLRGRDVRVRGSRVTRVQGGSVKLN
jgi:hypothetical protein